MPFTAPTADHDDEIRGGTTVWAVMRVAAAPEGEHALGERRG